MDPVLVALLIIFALGLIGFAISRKTANKAKKLGAKEYSVAIHMHGLPGVSQYELANLFFTEDKLIAESDKRTFELSYHQITAAECLRKTDLLKKDKSVIGRAIVGTILPFGLAGTLVGAISGVGQKKIKGDFLILNYITSKGAEPEVLIFDIKNFVKARKLANFVKSKMHIEQTVTL